MNGKPQLVLDIAGVIASNLSPLFWRELELRSGNGELKGRFDRDIRRRLWTGELREEQFWDWLGEQCPNIRPNEARKLLMQALKPLPAYERLQSWSRTADIHLVSNHCQEWLDPVLSGVQKYVQSVTISNQVGCCKPDLAIYRLVAERLESQSPILYVDDQEKNLQPAAALGWKTLLADPDQRWIVKVDSLLKEEADEPNSPSSFHSSRTL
jgi:FMN phosphatase YigB (HAD superfamily)